MNILEREGFKGTLGPWSFSGGDNASVEVDIDGTTACIDRCDKNTGVYIIERCEMEANGYLITAAPELLSALIGLVYTASSLWDKVKPIKDTEIMAATHPVIQEAKAVIAKALNKY